MRPLYILKIGGSVATHKNRPGVSLRTDLLKKIAQIIKLAKKSKNFDLILLHGAGGAGHQLAHKYNLKSGARKSIQKWRASFESHLTNQRLDMEIVQIFVSEGLRVISAHTASIIVQKNKRISKFNLEVIKEALRNNCIPILYGEMVFDEVLGMTICSGDAIVPILAKELNAQKIFFATDVSGVFNKDPYLHKDTNLLEKLALSEIKKGERMKLSESHNIDTTGGLAGKINNMLFDHPASLKFIEIFNGLEEENYRKIFANTIIHIKS
jgi:isopentenyl phosphate kinase